MVVFMKIVFFDGHCSLCNGLVDWLIRHDQRAQLTFASLQGQTARQTFHLELHQTDFDTLIYLRGTQRFERSTAVLSVLEDLGGAWKLVAVFYLVPRALRDVVYRFIARNRYRFFRRRDSCRVPTPDDAQRLLP